MRQLVYLSERKLQQFHPDRPRRGLAGVGGEVEAKIPAIGGMKVSRAAQANSTTDLTTAIRVIESSPSPVRWYEEAGLRAGEWVHFEAELNYAVQETDPGAALVFWDRRQRLFLHGSPEHLVGAGVAKRDSPSHFEALGASTAWQFNLMLSEMTKDEPHVETFIEAVQLLHRCMRRALPDEMAAWMGGYARVTKVEGPLVVASPLFVEYIATPDHR